MPITGDAPTKLSGTTNATANVSSSFLISANSSRVVFLADRDVDGVLELHSNSLDGTTGLIKLTGALLGTTGVTSFRVTPDGVRVVCRASKDTAGLSEIHSAPATAVGASIKLSSTIISGGNTTGQLERAPNGQRVVSLANNDSTTLLEPYSAPVDTVSTSLSASTSASTYRAFGFDITPDSRRVLCRDTRNSPNKSELFNAAIGAGSSNAPVAIKEHLRRLTETRLGW